MNWHPFALRFPLLKDADPEGWEAFKESVKKTRGNSVPVVYRTVAGEKEGIDGRNRELACEELGLKCRMEEEVIEDDEVKEFILARNVHRRHMTPELRREIVAELRADGKSTRQIADTLGVSHTTVQNDLKASGGKNLPPGVTGQDGKTYPAAPKILCERCKRVGARPGCNACKEARAKAKRRRREAAHENQALPTETTDAFGNPVPRGCIDAWSDPWVQDAYDFLCTCSETFRKERLADGMAKRQRHYPFFKAKDFIDGVGFVIQYLDALIDHIKTERPAGVCPSCRGGKCPDCRHSGLVPRAAYESLKKKGTA